MGAFLCWLGVRVLEMHRVLKPTGSLYLHIDYTAHAYAKALMDSIFGHNQFRDAITWARAAENLSRKKWRRGYETILFYSKTEASVWNQQFHKHDEEYIRKNYNRTDEQGRYTTTSCTNNAVRPNMIYEFNGNTRQWRYQKETMERYEREGRLVYNKAGIPRLKKYLHETPGVPMSNVWSDIDVLASNARERTGYPTQKPLALYERIIKASSNPGDIVLDPFAGCATTCVAAERLGRQWVGIDLNEPAREIIQRRLQSEVSASMAWGEIVQTPSEPPNRTDGGDAVAPELRVVSSKRNARRLPVREIREHLIISDGQRCQGCGWEPLYSDYLQVDHKKPRSLGGADDMENLTLLCDPCNRLKSNKLTLNELRQVRVDEGRVDADWWKEERWR